MRTSALVAGGNGGRRSVGLLRAGIFGLGLGLALQAGAASSTVTSGNASATISSSAPASLGFSVKRSGDPGYDVVVDYTTQDGGAVAGTDYTAMAGSVTIPAGGASATVSVPVASHSGIQADKQMYLQLLAAQAVGPQPVFAAQAAFAAGAQPAAVVAADLNGDGARDLVLANRSANTLSVLMNTTAPGAAAPSYAAAATVSTSTGPVDLAVGDFNGDGRPDLAVVANGFRSVEVFLNTTAPGAAAPSFAAGKNYPVGKNPQAVAVVDLNNDGKPDLVVSSSDTNSVSVLLNTAKTGASMAAFSAQQSFATDAGPTAMAIADLDGDGRTDLLVLTSAPSVSVLFNTTAPGATSASFAAQQPVALPHAGGALALADFNSDGRPDLAMGTEGGAGTVSVLLNTAPAGSATASFAAARTVAQGIGVIGLVSTDLNGDGKPDLVATSANLGLSRLINTTLDGSSTPRFAAPQNTAIAAGEADALVAADLDNDGKPDLAVASFVAGQVSTLLNRTPASAAFALARQQSFTVGGQPKSVAAADFNGDGKTDLAVANPGDGKVSILLGSTLPPGSASANFTAQQEFTATTTGQLRWVSAADMNGDGRPDLLVAVGNESQVEVLLNTTAPGAASPSFGAAQVLVSLTSAYAVTAVDLNGDGRPDLVLPEFSSSTHHFSVYLNSTAPGSATVSLGPQRTFPSSVFNPTSSAVADFNGDGLPDLLLGGADASTVRLSTTAPGALSASFSAETHLTNEGSYNVAAADINGDGKPDFVVFGGCACTPQRILPPAQTSGAPAQPNGFTANDAIQVFLNTTPAGAATLSVAQPQSFPIGDQSVQGGEVATADFDGDGRPDLLVTSPHDNTYSVLLNTTPPGAASASFAPQQVFASRSQPTAAAGVDVNGDGIADVVVSSAGSNTVTVQTNGLYHAGASATPGTGTIHYSFGPSSLSLSPASWSFPDELPGSTSPTKTFVLASNGPGVLHLASIGTSGDFAIASSTCGSSLASGKSCAIKASFTPTAAGARSGALVIQSDAASSPDQFALSGNGALPSLALTPDNWTYPARTVGSTSPTKAFTLKNTGSVAASLGSISATQDFVIDASSTCGASLGAGKSCAIRVSFTPSATGQRNGTLTVGSNAGNSPAVAALTGSGK